MNRLAVIAIAVLAQVEIAQAAVLDSSLRPLPRPASVSQPAHQLPSSVGLLRVDPSVPGVVISLRPLLRPGTVILHQPVLDPTLPHRISTAPTDVSTGGIAVSLRPILRPARPRRQSRADETNASSAAGQSQHVRPTGTFGLICGQRHIRGEMLEPIRGSLRGCGIDNPVRVHEVDGVRLSQPAIMSCDTASALQEWVSDGVRPAVRRLGGGIAQLQVAAHYSCRTRNNRTGAKLSEHGKGNAIDISGFTLANGRVISVEDGWTHRVDGNILRRIHTAACGPFDTVLGPAADRYHRDHFHLDIARHRGGRYCR